MKKEIILLTIGMLILVAINLPIEQTLEAEEETEIYYIPPKTNTKNKCFVEGLGNVTIEHCKAIYRYDLSIVYNYGTEMWDVQNDTQIFASFGNGNSACSYIDNIIRL